MKWIRVILVAGLTALYGVCPGRADDFSSLDFSTPDPLEQKGSSFSPAQNWLFSFGAGVAFIPNYVVNIPSFTGFSNTIPKKIDSAFTVEASLTRSLTDWVRVGLMGGIDTGHQASLSDEEAFGFSISEVHVELDETLHISKVVPIVQVGSWAHWWGWPVRPYVTLGVGGYQVDERQSLFLSYQSASISEELSTDSNLYMGALVGGGLSVGIGDHGTVGLEARYERIFSPGQPLQQWVPTLQCGYAF